MNGSSRLIYFQNTHPKTNWYNNVRRKSRLWIARSETLKSAFQAWLLSHPANQTPPRFLKLISYLSGRAWPQSKRRPKLFGHKFGRRRRRSNNSLKSEHKSQNWSEGRMWRRQTTNTLNRVLKRRASTRRLIPQRSQTSTSSRNLPHLPRSSINYANWCWALPPAALPWELPLPCSSIFSSIRALSLRWIWKRA